MKLWTLLLLVCGPVAVMAQNPVSVSSTAELTNETPESVWKRTLGQDASGYYLLRESGSVSNSVTFVEQYNPQMKYVTTLRIPGASGTFNDSRMHRYTELNNGHILTFHEGWSKTAGENSFIVQTYRMDGTSDFEKILETEPAPGQMKSASYSISISPDGSKLLVLTEKPFVKGNFEQIRLQVFSTADFSTIWKKDIQLENEGERYPDNEILLDNTGTAFLFKDIKISNKEHIYQFITTSASISTIKTIDLQGMYPTYHKLLLDNEGKPVIGGMLATAGQNMSYWQSVWYLRADAEGTILDNTIEPLGGNFLATFVQGKAAQEPGYKLQDYILRDVFPKPGGGILLVAEEEKLLKTIAGQTTPPVYDYDYTYGGIIVLSLDGQGKRIWNTHYDKKQTEKTRDSDVRYGSFTCQFLNNKLYFLWNYTDLRNDFPVTNFRYWVDRNGSKINIDNLYGKEALYPTLLTVINEDGSYLYSDRTFNALPLEQIQQPNAFTMAVDPKYFFTTQNGIIVMSRMPGQPTKKFKFNSIGY